MIKHLFTLFIFSLSTSITLAANIQINRGVIWKNGSDYQLKADIYRPTTGTAHPAVLMIHGGGWAAGKREELDWFGQEFANLGWVAVSIDYRLAKLGERTGEACLADVYAAQQALLDHTKELGIDKKRLAVLGGSAGGHLAAMLATEPNNPFLGAIILWGPTDLTRPQDEMTPRQKGMVTQFLGLGYSFETAKNASPYWRVQPGITPNWLLIHGSEDKAVPVSQSRAFADKLKNQHLGISYLEFAGEGHGIESLEAQKRGASAIQAFLTRLFH